MRGHGRRRRSRLTAGIAAGGEQTHSDSVRRASESPTPHVDPITENVTGYDFTLPTRFDKLFTGLAVERLVLPKEMNVAEQYDPEETFDAGYGRLLERAYEGNVEVVASPTGFDTLWTREIPGGVAAA